MKTRSFLRLPVTLLSLLTLTLAFSLTCVFTLAAEGNAVTVPDGQVLCQSAYAEGNTGNTGLQNISIENGQAVIHGNITGSTSRDHNVNYFFPTELVKNGTATELTITAEYVLTALTDKVPSSNIRFRSGVGQTGAIVTIKDNSILLGNNLSVDFKKGQTTLLSLVCRISNTESGWTTAVDYYVNGCYIGSESFKKALSINTGTTSDLYSIQLQHNQANVTEEARDLAVRSVRVVTGCDTPKIRPLLGASIRVGNTVSESGLRFSYEIDRAWFDSLGEDAEVGAIIVPADLTSGIYSLTHETLADIPYLDLPIEEFSEEESNENVYRFHASIIKLLDRNYARTFVSVAYIKIGDTYYYSSESSRRSVVEVAKNYLASGDLLVSHKARVLDYLDSVIFLSTETGEPSLLWMKNYYSPYAISYSTTGVMPALTFSLSDASASLGNIKSIVIDDDVFTGGWSVGEGDSFTVPYTVHKYAITYHLGGGTAENPSSYTYGGQTFTLANPTKEGATFLGWTYNGQTSPTLTATVPTGTTGNLTFTAHWSTDTSTIKALIDSFTFTASVSDDTSKMSTSPYEAPTVYPNASHPRILITPETIGQVRENLTHPENANAYARYILLSEKECTGILPDVPDGGTHNMNYGMMSYIEAKAFRYALTGEKQFGYEAIYAIKNYINTLEIITLADSCRAYGYTMFIAACVYDWCYDLLTEHDKTQITAGVLTNLAPHFEVGYPPKGQGAVTGHGMEAQLLRDWLAFSIATYGDYSELYEYVAGRLCQDFTDGPEFYMQSGSHWQGSGYGPNRFFFMVYAQLLFYTMTNGEYYFYSDALVDVTYTFLHYYRPDGQYFRIGDDFRERNTTYTVSDIYVCAFLLSSMYGDATLKSMAYDGLSEFTVYASSFLSITVPTFLRMNTAGTLSITDADPLPLVCYNGSPLGSIIARSAWSSADAVAVYMKIGEAYSANHEHKDAGTFHIYYKGILASDSGAYQIYGTYHDLTYHKQTIAHNSLLIYNPAYATANNPQYTTAKWQYSGGQSIHKPSVNGENGTLANWLAKSTSHQASILGHDYLTDKDGEGKEIYLYSYLAGNLTNAYDSDTVDEVSRYMLSVMTDDPENPMAFFVYDRITAVNASFKKTFLLHMQTEPTVYADADAATIVNGGGKMHVQSLYTDVTYTKIGGTGNEFNVNGLNYPIQDDPDFAFAENSLCESGWGRIEISPSAQSKTDRLLTVMYVTDAENGDAIIPASEIKSGDAVGATILGKTAVFPLGTSIGKKFSFTAEGEGTSEYLIAGLTAGLWSVSVNGVSIGGSFTVEDGALLSFTAPLGTVTLTPAVSKDAYTVHYDLAFNGDAIDDNGGSVNGGFSTDFGGTDSANVKWSTPAEANGYDGYLTGEWNADTLAIGEMINLYGLSLSGSELTVSMDLMGSVVGNAVSTTKWHIRLRTPNSGASNEANIFYLNNDGTMTLGTSVPIGAISASGWTNVKLVITLGETRGSFTVTAYVNGEKAGSLDFRGTFVTALSDITRVQIYGHKPSDGSSVSPKTYFDNLRIYTK